MTIHPSLDRPAIRVSPAFDILIPPQPAPSPPQLEPERPNAFTPAEQPSRWPQLLALLIAPATLTVLGIWGLTRHGDYGADESATRWAALLPLHDLFHLLSRVDAVHGLYYLGMHGLMIFGDGPLALRVPSLISAVLAAAVITELGRRLTGRVVVGVIAGLMYAVNPFVMFYAQTARSYATVSLLVAAASLALIRAIEAEDSGSHRVSVRRWVGYGVLISFAGWLNEMALLVVAAHAITVFWSGSRRARINWLKAAGAAVVSVSPLFIISSGEQDAVDWITRPTPGDVLTLFRNYFGPHPLVMVVTLSCAIAALFAAHRSRGANQQRVTLATLALPLLLLPPLLLIVESEVATPLYVDRYLLYSGIGAVLLVGEGAYRIGRAVFEPTPNARTWTWIAGLLVVAFTFAVQLPTQQTIRTPDSRLRNFGATARFVAHYSRPGDGVLFVGSFFRLARLGYPEEFRNLRDIGLSESPMASGSFRGVEAPFLDAAPEILASHRIWLIGHPPNGQMPDTLYTAERNLLVASFQLRRYAQFQGVTVTLWDQRPTTSQLRIRPTGSLAHDVRHARALRHSHARLSVPGVAGYRLL